jgi:hypothetical protein
VHLILGQEEFEDAAREAERLNMRSSKVSQRIISGRFERGMSEPELDLSEYVKTLLTAYLARPTQIKLYRNRSERAPESSQSLHVIFDVEPFSLRNGEEKIVVDESSALAPIIFRDYLRRITLSRVDIVSLRFGCLEVEYLVRSSRNNWKSNIKNRKEIDSISKRLNIKNIY